MNVGEGQMCFSIAIHQARQCHKDTAPCEVVFDIL